MRKDAASNRERLLAAARETFRANGVDAPLEAVARAAGVSRTTLFRHFPTRELLAANVFSASVIRIEGRADELDGRTDGIVVLFHEVLAEQLDDPGLARVIAGSGTEDLQELAARVARAFEPLVSASDNGVVWDGVDTAEVMAAFSMAAGAINERASLAGPDGRLRLTRMLHRALFRTPVPAHVPT